MTIKVNFLIGYSITAILLVILGAVVFFSLIQINSRVKAIDQKNIQGLLRVNDMYEELQESIPEVYHYVTYGDAASKANFEEKMTSYDRWESEFRQIEKIGKAGEDSKEGELLANLHNSKIDYKNSTEEMFVVSEKSHKLEKNDFNKFNAREQAMHSALDDLLNFSRKNLIEANNGIDQMIRQIVLFMVVVGFLVGAVAGVVALFMIGSILKPLAVLQDSVIAISNGDLNRRAHVIGKNEVGILAQSFNVMADKVEKGLDELKIKNTTLEKQSSKLKDQLDMLEKFQKVTVDRELKMIELKERIAKFEKEKK